MSAAQTGRCTWAGDDPLYIHYHDTEWGVPQTDDLKLFEKLILEGFQAGLSWITILRKRPHFRKVFDGFQPEKIVRYNDKKIAALMVDPGIVRNKLKIEATIDNAKAYLKLVERESLAHYIWEIAGGEPQQNRHASMGTVQPETPTSKAISKALKAEGFRFVGPTTVYAFMQSMGMVNDHFIGCPQYGVCAAHARKFIMPKARAS